jgi:hypothetical protein
MARLATALVATALVALGRLEARPITRWRLGGVARTAADLLAQLGQFARQRGELAAELVVLLPESLNLLLLSKNQRSVAGWCCQPIRFWNPGRRRAHHRRILPEMQPRINLPSRVQQG